MHIGAGLVCGNKISEMVEAGFDFTVFLADWHSMVNNKFGGNLEKIRRAGEYFKHCFTALGLPEGRVHFVWASELTGRSGYWERVLRVGKSTTAQRMMRALPIMGREGGEKLGWGKPVCLHTPLLPGLSGFGDGSAGFDEDPKLSRVIAAKMSKSRPESSVWVHDEPAVIEEKLRKAFCPPRVAEGNPVLEYFRILVFGGPGTFLLRRDPKHGGDLELQDYSDLERLYLAGKVHPQDLKGNIVRFLSERLLPVREYFVRRPEVLAAMVRLGAGGG